MKNQLKLFSSVVLVCAFFMVSIGLEGGEKRAFTIDDLYGLKGISGPELSPDGKGVLFSVTESSLQKGTSNKDLYYLDLLSGESRQLTFCKKSDHHPFWSHDGKKIYFLSNRGDTEQLYVMDVRGGEARKVSNFYTGIGSPVVSKKNNQLFFTSTVFAECMTDCDCNKKMADKLENGPVQAHMGDSLLYRHWDGYRDWQYTHLFSLDLKSGKVKAVTSGKVDYPPFSLGGGQGYDLSPDGSLVCIVSNHDEKPEHSTNSDLFLVDLETPGFKPVNITKKNKGYDGEPVFSSDGRWIAYVSQKTPGYESECRRLVVYNRNSGHSKILTESIDNWIESFHWAPGKTSRFIYFTVQEKGYRPLYHVDIKSGKIEKLLDGYDIRDFQVTPDNKQIILKRSAVGQPYELWSWRIGKKQDLKRLTFFNKGIQDTVDIRSAEVHWVEGAEGKKVQVFLVKPHDFDASKKYPLIMNIHGGPQMMWSDGFRGDWQVYPGAGYIVAFPNPHGSTGYGQAFTAAISKDWTGRVMEDIYKVSDYLAGLPYVDGERMGAMGWSWGGYAVMWLEGHNKHFKALASMMGIYNGRTMYSGTEELWFPLWDIGAKPWEKPEVYEKISPSSYTKNFKTPCLVITGERDYRVAYTHSIEFFTDLQEMNVPSRLIVFKEDGHWPHAIKSMPVYYNAHLEWFHKFLKGGKAPYETEKMIRNLAFCEKKKDKAKDNTQEKQPEKKN